MEIATMEREMEQALALLAPAPSPMMPGRVGPEDNGTHDGSRAPEEGEENSSSSVYDATHEQQYGPGGYGHGGYVHGGGGRGDVGTMSTASPTQPGHQRQEQYQYQQQQYEGFAPPPPVGTPQMTRRTGRGSSGELSDGAGSIPDTPFANLQVLSSSGSIPMVATAPPGAQGGPQMPQLQYGTMVDPRWAGQYQMPPQQQQQPPYGYYHPADPSYHYYQHQPQYYYQAAAAAAAAQHGQFYPHAHPSPAALASERLPTTGTIDEGAEPIVTLTPHHVDIDIRDDQILLSARACLSRPGFVHALVAFTVSGIVINTLSTYMDYLVRLNGAGREYVGIVGGTFQFVIMISSLIVGKHTDKTRAYYSVTIGLLVLGAFALAQCGVSLDADRGGDVRWALIVTAALVGPLQPVATELGVDVVYPLSENTVLVIQQLFSNLLSALFIPFFKMVKDVGTAPDLEEEEMYERPQYTFSFYLLIVLHASATVFFATFNGRYLRYEHEMAKKAGKEAAAAGSSAGGGQSQEQQQQIYMHQQAGTAFHPVVYDGNYNNYPPPTQMQQQQQPMGVHGPSVVSSYGGSSEHQPLMDPQTVV